jgi:hypothetical protein
MGSNIWKMVETDILLDNGDVIEGLAKKLHNVEFMNETYGSVYPVDVERTEVNELVVSMSDGTEFVLTCKRKGE